MSRRKTMMLVIDTETCNSLEQPLVYDIGYAICDREGNKVLERSFVAAEIFLDQKELMKSCYYAKKIPQYWEDIKAGKRELKSLFNIRKQIHADMKKHKVKLVGAYNMGFDKRALNNTIRYCSKSLIRWFFPFGTEYFCIWNMACQVILSQTSYIKFAIKNGLVSEKDNIQTSAESCYKFLTKQLDFVESHTGLEDVNIEIEIMVKCFKMHKKMSKNIYSACWMIPQRKRKELDLRKTFKGIDKQSIPRNKKGAKQMALNKAIASGKEYRKEYRRLAQRIAKSCRCHGGCDWCLSNRMYKYEKQKQKTADMLKEFLLEME